MTITGAVRRRMLLPDPIEVTIGRRGFDPASAAATERLETVGHTFLHGLGTALASADAKQVGRELIDVPSPVRGFGFEGAAMGLAIGDALTLWRRGCLARFAAGPGEPHIYMVQVGVGWAMARLPRPLWRRVQLPDPVLRWLTLDGFGFHQAYFHTQQYVHRHAEIRVHPPWPDPTGYAPRVLDQGIGRALWFVAGADVDRVAGLVTGFDPRRRPDLWSGVGLAATYAGGADRAELVRLLRLAGRSAPQVAQGAAFAAKARIRAGLVTEETVTSVGVLCESGVAAAALLTDDTLQSLSPESAPDGNRDGVPVFELWRQQIQAALQHVQA